MNFLAVIPFTLLVFKHKYKVKAFKFFNPFDNYKFSLNINIKHYRNILEKPNKSERKWQTLYPNSIRRTEVFG